MRHVPMSRLNSLGKKDMIVETGRVIKVEAGKAIIEIEKHSACGNCKAACACMETGLRQIEAADPIGVKLFQTVEISIPDEAAFQASMVLFGIPLAALLAGIVIGNYIGVRIEIENVCEMLGGVFGLGLSFFIIRAYNNRFKKHAKNQPVIIAVMA